METKIDTIHIPYRAKSSRVLYDICDLNGSILKTGGYNSEDAFSELKINVEGIEKGAYFLYIIDGSETTKQKIIV